MYRRRKPFHHEQADDYENQGGQSLIRNHVSGGEKAPKIPETREDAAYTWVVSVVEGCGEDAGMGRSLVLLR